jgi:hypothetical protein
MSEPKFYDLMREVDSILAIGPKEEQVARFVELTKEPALHQYAFDHISDPNWIKPLQAKSLFSAPPQPIRDEPKGTVGFPFWPESRYLARMATSQMPTVQQAVCEIALQVETDNIQVHADLCDAALAMPTEMAAKWAEKEIRWIEQQHNLYFLLPEKLGNLIRHLAKGGKAEVALDLARALLAVLPDPRVTEKVGDERPYRLPLEPRARFDGWDYKAILEKNVPELVSVVGEKALSLLCDLLDSAVRLSRHSEEDTGPEDYSYIWRSAIEDHEQNHSSGLRDFLVTAVRDAAGQIARADSSQVPLLVEKLERH